MPTAFVTGLRAASHAGNDGGGGAAGPLARRRRRGTKQETAAKSELEHTEADLEGWQEVLSLAIKLADNCHAAYLKANPKVRRRFNDAVLESLYTEDGKVARAEFTEVFQALFSRPSSNKALSVVLRERCANRELVFLVAHQISLRSVH